MRAVAKRTLLQERAAELIDQHGSTRAAGRVLRLSGPYLYRLMTGEATEPTDAVLRKLKLRRVVSYERTDAVPALDGQTFPPQVLPNSEPHP